MIGMDIFKDDAFSARSMTAALDKMKYQPSYMSSLPGLITDVPVITPNIMIEQRTNGARLTGYDEASARASRYGN